MPIATRQHHRAIAFRLAITERVRTFLAPGCWLLDLHRFLDEVSEAADLISRVLVSLWVSSSFKDRVLRGFGNKRNLPPNTICSGSLALTSLNVPDKP